MKNIKNILIFTDCVDLAFNELYVTLHQALIKADLNSIHISPKVAVDAFSVVNAAFAIRSLADIVDHQQTLFVVVVNGVSTSPARIFGQTQSGLTFVGNNSGYFNWLIDDFGLESLYKNHTNRQVNGRSFGGRHVQIPTVMNLLTQDWDKVGERVDNSFLSNFKIEDGTIVHIDNFGLVKIKAPALSGLQQGDALRLRIEGKGEHTVFYTQSLKQEENNTPVLFEGSSLYGLPEIGITRHQHSASAFGVIVGDKVTWEKIQ